jgi:hypothetical protein
MERNRRNRRERLDDHWDMSDVVANRMNSARQLRGKTQTWVAERMTRFTTSKWSVSAVSAAEGGTAGGRPRSFNANEIVALSRTFDLPIPYFFVPPEKPQLPPDFPDAPSAGWDYLLYLLFGDDHQQKLLSQVLDADSIPKRTSIPTGDAIDDGTFDRATSRSSERAISSNSLLAAALYGVMVSNIRGGRELIGGTGNAAEIFEALTWAIRAIDGYNVGRFVYPEVAADIEEREVNGIEEDG